MVNIVQLPNGQEAEFPDGMSPEQISSIIQKQFPPTKSSSKSGDEDPFLMGLTQGALNIGPGLANLIPGVNLKKFDFAPQNAMGAIGDVAGSLLGFGGAGKAAMALPKVPEALSKAKNILQQLPGMTGKRGNAIAEFLGNVGKNALYGATEDSENQLQGAALGGALGGLGHGAATAFKNPLAQKIAGGLAGGTVGAALSPAIGQNPYYGGGLGSAAGILGTGLLKGKGNALRDLQKIVSEEGLARKGEAKSVLGLNITPAEAMGTREAAALEGITGGTKKGREYQNEFMNQRDIQEPESIKKALKQIYPREKYLKEEKPLFEKAKAEKMPKKAVLDLATHPELAEATTEMLNNKRWARLANQYDTDQIGFFATLKEYMQKVLRPSVEKVEGLKGTVNLIDDDIKYLTNTLTEHSPTYKEALKVSQPRYARREIEQGLKEKGYTAKNMEKLLGNDAALEKLIPRFKDHPEIQKKLDVMSRVYKDLKEIPGAKEVEKAVRDKQKDPKILKWYEFALEQARKIGSGKYNTELTRLMTSPNWDKELLKISDVKDKEVRAKKFIDLLSKASAKGAIAATTGES